MRRLHRLLEGLRKNTGFPPLAGGRHPQTTDHIRACTECASALRRQRQYIERLRTAAVPAASDELTARLLLRTQQLAMAPAPVARPSRMRLAGLAGGVAVVAAGAVAAGAYTVAGEPGQYAAGTASLYGQSGHSPGTDSRLAALRSSGWTCPELRAMGFRLVSASTTVLAGRPTVELRLTDGQHTARILEQHQGSPTAPSPVNPLTGHPAGNDGYVPLTRRERRRTAGSGSRRGHRGARSTRQHGARSPTCRTCPPPRPTMLWRCSQRPEAWPVRVWPPGPIRPETVAQRRKLGPTGSNAASAK
jgi:hypothetical protein